MSNPTELTLEDLIVEQEDLLKDSRQDDPNLDPPDVGPAEEY